MSSVRAWSRKMQRAYTQQTYEQYPSTPSQNSGSGSLSHPRVVRKIQQDVYRDQLAVPTRPGNGNDSYGGGSISGYDFNHLFYRPIKLNILYSNLGQGETNYAGYHFDTNQVPGSNMNAPLSGANANQGASDSPPIWRLHTCWVSRAEQDEIHLTIALRKT
ncbi:hypothetical protein BJV77DRAFT_961731 [Russula vinacea]|nr:hypothetical protein BJV77DRAFT_961731 [Russula vinacea]